MSDTSSCEETCGVSDALLCLDMISITIRSTRGFVLVGRFSVE